MKYRFPLWYRLHPLYSRSTVIFEGTRACPKTNDFKDLTATDNDMVASAVKRLGFGHGCERC